MAESVVLAAKIYVAGDARERTLRSLRGLVGDRLADLEADVDLEVREDDFPVVTLEGPDARAGRNVLAEEFGEIPAELAAGETYVGTLEGWDDEGLVLDAGREVRIPAEGVGLGPGSPQQVVERFGLVQHLPMRFVYGGDGETAASEETDDEGEQSEGGDEGKSSEGDEAEEREATDGVVTELADAERDRLYDWQRGPGRVTVNSATRSEVRATVNRAGHARDIVTVERLGLLEQSVVCKDGTDPPGLIASIGEYLPAELRAVV